MTGQRGGETIAEIRSHPFPLQSDLEHEGAYRFTRPKRTLTWEEADDAWMLYDALGHGSQSCNRIAERGGFGLYEIAYLEDECRQRGRIPTAYQGLAMTRYATEITKERQHRSQKVAAAQEGSR